MFFIGQSSMVAMVTGAKMGASLLLLSGLRASDLGSDLDQAIVALRRIAIALTSTPRGYAIWITSG
jgi:hypothetical protein